MHCPHCEKTFGLAKGLAKRDDPDECPDCGESLEKDNPARLEK